MSYQEQSNGAEEIAGGDDELLSVVDEFEEE